jgi:hypothetical protein
LDGRHRPRAACERVLEEALRALAACGLVMFHAASIPACTPGGERYGRVVAHASFEPGTTLSIEVKVDQSGFALNMTSKSSRT